MKRKFATDDTIVTFPHSIPGLMFCVALISIRQSFIVSALVNFLIFYHALSVQSLVIPFSHFPVSVFSLISISI